VLTAATVAFVPMYTAISAAVNNDSLANALAAVTLAALMVGRRRGFSDRWAVGLGVLVGALVLTKLTVYVYVPIILGTLLLAGSESLPETAPRWHALRWPAIASLTGLVVSGWWLVRNALVYGPLDVFALQRHDAIVVGQPRWTGYDLASIGFFLKILFRSFWGVFGWMGVVLDDGFYWLYLAFTLLAVGGYFFGARLTSPPDPRPSPVTPRPSPLAPRPSPLALLIAATLLVFAEIAYYNLTFIQPQGRYLFPALVPIAVFLAVGWWKLARRATAPPEIRTWRAGPLAAAIAWSLGEVHGSLVAGELWSDNALIAAATIGVAVVAFAPFAVRRWLPITLGLLLAATLGLLDQAALVKFVAPAFPLR
jgi:4-amino-4-deoxy-L-arabinose transferase-like glycosyltransferase